jgi:hypothetical protein
MHDVLQAKHITSKVYFFTQSPALLTLTMPYMHPPICSLAAAEAEAAAAAATR